MSFAWLWRPIAALLLQALLSTAGALASQGPGGGQGTASAATQLAMAIIVYGAAALIVSAGFIGLLKRRRWRAT